MKLILTLELGNDAMQTRDDVAGAVRASLARNEGRDGWLPEPLAIGDTGFVRGNTVGRWFVVAVTEPE